MRVNKYLLKHERYTNIHHENDKFHVFVFINYSVTWNFSDGLVPIAKLSQIANNNIEISKCGMIFAFRHKYGWICYYVSD